MINSKIKDNVRDKLDPRVIFIVIFSAVIEFELFNMGKQMISVAGRDAWLSVLLGSFLITLITYLVVRLASRFPQENLWQYSQFVWGRSLNYLIATSYFIIWALFLILLYRNTAEINQFFFLSKTPLLLPPFLMGIGAVWLVSYGLTPLIRFFQLTFPLLILPVFVTMLLTLKEIDFTNFLPILEKGFLPVLKGAVIYAGHMQGLEIIFFLMPFLTNAHQAVKPAILGISTVNLFAFFQTISAIGILGINNTQEMLWPSVSILELIEIPGFPAERFELFLTLPWLIAIFTTLSLALYLLSYGIVQIFNLENKKATIYLAAIITLFASSLIPNFAWTIQIRDTFDNFSIPFVFLFPLLTLVIAIYKRKAGENIER